MYRIDIVYADMTHCTDYASSLSTLLKAVDTDKVVIKITIQKLLVANPHQLTLY